MYFKQITVTTVIDKEEAKELIDEAKYFASSNGLKEEVVAYHEYDGMLHRVFAINKDLPYNIDKYDEDQLLQFVRDNIPESVRF